MYQNRSNDSWREQQNRQNRPSQGNYRNRRNENYPENYRGEYRFDERDNYQRMNRENYSQDPRYSHPSGFRSDQDQYRQRRQPDRYPNQNNYNQNENYRYRNNYDQNQNDNYRNRSYYGNSGNYMSNNDYPSYGASRNYGSMGSYGGAQGYGSSRNGYNTDGWGSGHRGSSFQPHHAVYGAYRDKNSYAEGEKVSYDGSQRYGSQGADTSRRRDTSSGYRTYRGYSSQNPDDSRYEIYDSALSQYNRGSYGNPSGGSFSDSFNIRSHQDLTTQHNYGSRQRGRNRQGSGSDQEYGGTSDLGYNSVGENFSRPRPSYVSAPQNLYFDDLSGEIRDRNWERY